jgi:hypothetical protein
VVISNNTESTVKGALEELVAMLSRCRSGRQPQGTQP